MCVSFVCGIERLAGTFHIRVDDGSSSCCLLNMLEEWCDEEKCSLDFIFSQSISKATRPRDENVTFSPRTKDFPGFSQGLTLKSALASPCFPDRSRAERKSCADGTSSLPIDTRSLRTRNSLHNADEKKIREKDQMVGLKWIWIRDDFSLALGP